MATIETDASKLIDEKIRELGDWRGKTLSRVRKIIKEADPGVVEEWKWVTPTKPGTPVWSHAGIICTGETYKSVVKLTFFNGAALKDPSGLFNSSLDGKVRRAIDIREDDKINEAALKNRRPCVIDVHVDAEVRPPSTGTWQLPPTPYKEPMFGKPWVA